MKQQHTRIISTVFAAGGLLAVSASGAHAAPADNGDTTRVFICHATGEDGYERVGVSLQEAVDGHSGHADDIIPPFEEFAGQNYDGEGRDIWNNGCNDPNEDQTGDDETDDDETGDDQGEDSEEATPPADEDQGDDADAQEPEVVQTDGAVAEDNSMLAALSIGMLFAGGATLVAVGSGVTGRRG